MDIKFNTNINQVQSDYYKTGNKVEFLNSEEVTSKELEIILSAKDTIHISKYSFNSMLLANLLAKKAKEGVKVRVVTDPLSLFGSSKEWQKKLYVIEYLKENGVEVQTFPLIPLDRYLKSFSTINTIFHTIENNNENSNDYEDKINYQLMHSKVVSVDGKRAVISGVNWSDGSFKNIDAGVFVEGKVIDDLEKNFWFLFKRSGGKDYNYVPRAEEAGNSKVSLLLSDKMFSKTSYSAAVYRAVSNAKDNIYLSAFVLSDPYLIKLLIDAKNRGVKVNVILDPNKSENYSNLNYDTAEKLKKAGIIPRWYKVQTYNTTLTNYLHTKLLITDDTLIVGSGNFSYKGLRINHEVGIQTDDKNAISKARDYFEQIWNENTSLEPHLPNNVNYDGS